MDMIQRKDGERIGQYAQRLMTSTDMKNPDILTAVRAQFSEAKTTMACIAWYRSDLKKQGKTVVPPPEPMERTPELVMAEIEEAKQMLLSLEEELVDLMEKDKTKRAERKAALEAELAELAKLEKAVQE